MKRLLHLFLSVSLLTASTHTLAQDQKVGLVLSGGGASGMAHIGVIMAMEEQGIPIDYISGTSIGALVGGLYSAGYSPQQMIEYFTSERFQRMVQGKLEEQYVSSLKHNTETGSWVRIKFSKKEILKSTLPTNLISPISLDLELLENLAAPSAAAGYNFDSLMVPFRCVAADIGAKEEYVFDGGDLTQAIRASIAYPLYLKPLDWDGRILFDGGLYNNFPVKIMRNDFSPDIMIGSLVASKLEPPDDEDVVSQIKNMVMRQQDFKMPEEEGILIKPQAEAGVFDFKSVMTLVNNGYKAAMNNMDEIKKRIEPRRSVDELSNMRNQFRSEIPKFRIDSISVQGLNKKQSNYVLKVLEEKTFLRKKRVRPLNTEQLKSKYYTLFEDDKIASIYPSAEFDPRDSLFNLNLDIDKEKDFFVDFGGNFSSRPINMGYIGLQYNHLGNMSLSLMANSYFGKFYGSGYLGAKMNFPYKRSIYFQPSFTLNRWNYFKSNATFFEDQKPSYIVMNEAYSDFMLGWPLAKLTRVQTGVTIGNLTDDYYQTDDFTSLDTTDVTRFSFSSGYVHFERNTLNRKQYANKGSYLGLKARYIDGIERTTPGSTSEDKTFKSNHHQWSQLKLIYDTYYKQRGHIRLGLYLEGVYSTQPLFSNYTASVIRAPSFTPIPYANALFLETFRAYQYLAAGHKLIYNIVGDLDLRIEGYIFQPYRSIQRFDDNTIAYSENWERRFTVATATAVYNSPLGPVSLGLNYFLNVPEVALENREPVNLVFNFGYLIFNRRALD